MRNNKKIYICAGLDASLKVLERLKKKKLNCNVDVATFHNGREKGLTYSVFLDSDKSFTFATYEHRNSDQIIINGTPGYMSAMPYMTDSKYDYLGAFSPKSYGLAANKLAKLINQWIESEGVVNFQIA